MNVPHTCATASQIRWTPRFSDRATVFGSQHQVVEWLAINNAMLNEFDTLVVKCPMQPQPLFTARIGQADT
ncbi:MAG: hypothetical protein WAK67_10870 [Xanthobacteraceae bacterium]